MQLVSRISAINSHTIFPFSGGNLPQPRTLLSISVPPGVLPGQTLAVKVPDGRELTVVVPNGARQDAGFLFF